MNRLTTETSPYLRQHRDNPVDWYPWGEAAFAEARHRDRPILLSVGYSACHWCHVMAHESFEDEATARLMNDRFVNVKVDREERPDVDSIYMDAVQAMTGRGGWPMTVFLTPDGRPFYAGTYFPPRRRGPMPSFTEVMDAVDDAWRHRRDELDTQADRLTAAVGRTLAVTSDELPGLDTLDRAAALCRDAFDDEWGGFGSAPKFPASMTLDALLLVHRRTGDPDVARMVTTSLDAMASGGIYDHLGGGFARYSVDDQWLIPHFEKMLYDNALLVRVYLHAWQATGDARYLQTVEETIDYVLDDLALPGGGFASARDADSEGVEGRFYGWSVEEISDVVAGAGVDPERALTWWGVTEEGNFAEAGRDRANILHRPVRGDLLRPPEIETARQALARHRCSRVTPGLDDKVLTEWNALMLGALAEAAAATGDPRWWEASVTAGEFLLTELRRTDGRWLRSWQAGDGTGGGGARHLAYAHDHAAVVDAFTRLAELTGEARWITAARATADALLELFTDHDNGGFFTTGTDAEPLLIRPKDLMDNATPSAQSSAAVALLRLHALVGEPRYLDAAEGVLRLLGELAGANPIAFGNLLVAVDLHATGIAEVAIVGSRPDLVDVARGSWRPHVVLAHGEPYPSPLWEGRADDLAYVCQAFTCRTPTGDTAELMALLDEADPGPPVA